MDENLNFMDLTKNLYLSINFLPEFMHTDLYACVWTRMYACTHKFDNLNGWVDWLEIYTKNQVTWRRLTRNLFSLEKYLT